MKNFTRYLLPILLLISVSISIQYNLNQSKENAYYAAITHCPGKQVQSWTCKLCPNVTGLTNVTYIENTRTHIVGFSGYDPKAKKIIFSFRSTIDWRNFIQDISFVRMPFIHCKQCEIHLGFYESYRSIENKILLAVSKLTEYDPTAQIVCIGHSLGGALATITAIQLQLKYNKVKQLHTFGAPRVGNQALAKFLKQKLPNTIRVIHYRDLAPHLPFEANGYRHQPYEVLFDEGMKQYQVCNDSGQDIHCSNSYFPNYSEKWHQVYWFEFNC